MKMEPIVMSWSGGKDSALTLKRLQDTGMYDIRGLLTTFSGMRKRVNLHYTHFDLIRAQSESIGIPLIPVFISENAGNREYEIKHREAYRELKKDGILKIAFGDIFLEPIRHYRDDILQRLGVQGVYPLWQENTAKLLEEFVSSGFRARTTAIDMISLEEEFLDREVNEQFIKELPETVDPCGENGEYHSFVYDGPYYSRPVNVHCNHRFTMDFRPKIEMMLKVCRLELKGIQHPS